MLKYAWYITYHLLPKYFIKTKCNMHSKVSENEINNDDIFNELR